MQFDVAGILVVSSPLFRARACIGGVGEWRRSRQLLRQRTRAKQCGPSDAAVPKRGTANSGGCRRVEGVEIMWWYYWGRLQRGSKVAANNRFTSLGQLGRVEEGGGMSFDVSNTPIYRSFNLLSMPRARVSGHSPLAYVSHWSYPV